MILFQTSCSDSVNPELLSCKIFICLKTVLFPLSPAPNERISDQVIQVSLQISGVAKYRVDINDKRKVSACHEHAGVR